MMLRQMILVLAVIVSLLVGNAKEYTVEEIPMVHLQDARRYVSNPDNILSSQAVAAIDTTLFNLEQKTGIQTIVVVVSNIAGGDEFDFAFQLGEKNGVGEKKRDNGLVILLATELGAIQFVTGYGIEGDLPDAVCKRIQQRHMVPHFKQKDWDTGMIEGVRAVAQRLDGSMTREDSEEDDTEAAFFAFGIAIFAFIFVMILLIVIEYCNNRCPKCGKHKIKRQSSKLLSRSNGTKLVEVTYTCQRCGHVFSRQERHADDTNNNRRSGGGGGFIIGGGGFGSGGGGFSGGSFGGGSFGGGGAGSRF